MINIKGKTVVDFDISDSYVTLHFDDGSGAEFTARVVGGCCGCSDAELEVTETDPPQLGPEPPPEPPRPAPVSWFHIRGVHQVTLLRLNGHPNYPYRTATFTVDGDPQLYRAFVYDWALQKTKFPARATLTIKERSTFEKLEDINRGFPAEKLTYTWKLET